MAAALGLEWIGLGWDWIRLRFGSGSGVFISSIYLRLRGEKERNRLRLGNGGRSRGVRGRAPTNPNPNLAGGGGGFPCRRSRAEKEHGREGETLRRARTRVEPPREAGRVRLDGWCGRRGPLALLPRLLSRMGRPVLHPKGQQPSPPSLAWWTFFLHTSLLGGLDLLWYQTKVPILGILDTRCSGRGEGRWTGAVAGV